MFFTIKAVKETPGFFEKVNMKLSNVKLNKLKSATKNATEVTLTLSSNLTGSTEADFLHNLQLTDRHVLVFARLLQTIHFLM